MAIKDLHENLIKYYEFQIGAMPRRNRFKEALKETFPEDDLRIFFTLPYLSCVRPTQYIDYNSARMAPFSAVQYLFTFISTFFAPFPPHPSQQRDHSDRDLSSVPMEGGPSRFLSSQCHHDPRSHFSLEKVPFFAPSAGTRAGTLPCRAAPENFSSFGSHLTSFVAF